MPASLLLLLPTLLLLLALTMCLTTSEAYLVPLLIIKNIIFPEGDAALSHVPCPLNTQGITTSTRPVSHTVQNRC